MSERSAHIKARLQVLNAEFELIDESHQHVGHSGAGSGSHYRLIISSNELARLNKLSAHRQIYGLVQDLIPHEIHALAIEIRGTTS